MIKTFLKWALLVVLLAYVVTATMWGASQEALRKCAGVEVELVENGSNMPVNINAIREEIINTNPEIIGRPLSAVNTKEIEKHLMALQYFEDAQCYLSSQGNLKVKVKAMVPALRVFVDSGSYYINKEGKRISARPEFYSDVPIVSGNFSEKFPAKDLLPLCRFIESDSLLNNLVTMVKVDTPNNIMLSTIWHGHVVNFGDTSRPAEKFRNLKAAYRQILPAKGWNSYDTIYVKYKGQIVATRADKASHVYSPAFEDEPDPEQEALLLTDMSPHDSE